MRYEPIFIVYGAGFNSNAQVPEFEEGSSGLLPDPEAALPALEHTPPIVSVSRSGRVRRPPRALEDFLPSSMGGLPTHILSHTRPAMLAPSVPQPAPAEPASADAHEVARD